MRPKRNSDEQRSLTQKTNCCLIYFQICRTKRQQSSSKAAHTISTSAAFFMVLLAEKRVRTQVLTVKKAKEVPGICFVLPNNSFFIFLLRRHHAISMSHKYASTITTFLFFFVTLFCTKMLALSIVSWMD